MNLALALLTQLLLILLVVTAAILGSVIGYLYLRARRNENTELTPEQKEELRQRDGELSMIRTRIDEIYENQRTGAETQQAIVQQQFEQLNNDLRSRSREIEGLKGQLRHEIDARRTEMDQLKAQLDEAVTLVMRPQLGPAQSDADPAPEPTLREEPTLQEEPTPHAPAAPSEVVEPPPAEQPIPERVLFDDFDEDEFPLELVDEDDREALDFNWETIEPASEPEAPEPQPADELVSLFDAPDGDLPTLDNLSLETEPQHEAPPPPAHETYGSTDTPPAQPEVPAERPVFEPLDEETLHFQTPEASPTATPPAESFQTEEYQSSGDGVLSHETQPAEHARPEAAIPEGADDLTAIPMIDEERQHKLYELGFLTITDVAHLNRTQAEVVAQAIGQVDPDEVATDWVFAAQSILFARYQAEMSQPRPQAA